MAMPLPGILQHAWKDAPACWLQAETFWGGTFSPAPTAGSPVQCPQPLALVVSCRQKPNSRPSPEGTHLGTVLLALQPSPALDQFFCLKEN